MLRKLQAQHQEIGGTKFDSRAEANFFTLLKHNFKGEIRLQEEITLIPPTRHFSAQKWKVDFTLVPHGRLVPTMRVEYKGGWCKSNSSALQLLRYQVRLYDLNEQDIPLVLTGDRAIAGSFPNHFKTVETLINEIKNYDYMDWQRG